MKIELWFALFCTILLVGSITAAAYAYAQADQPVKKQICIVKIVYLGIINGQPTWEFRHSCFFPED